MNRTAILLSAAGAVLLAVLFFVLVFQPARAELAEVEEQIALEEQEQQRLQAEIDRLASVRQEAPEVEADLAAADAIVPRDPALPAALRQLQVAADESGVVLNNVSTARPASLEEPAEDGLSSIDLEVQLEGGYFQVIDFLRRVEDPSISPRGVLWRNGVVVRTDEAYPDLQVSLSGRTFAVIDLPVPPEPEPEPEPEPGDADETTEDDAEPEDES